MVTPRPDVLHPSSPWSLHRLWHLDHLTSPMTLIRLYHPSHLFTFPLTIFFLQASLPPPVPMVVSLSSHPQQCKVRFSDQQQHLRVRYTWKISGSTPNLNQNLHLNRTNRLFLCTAQFGECHSQSPPLCLSLYAPLLCPPPGVGI